MRSCTVVAHSKAAQNVHMHETNSREAVVSTQQQFRYGLHVSGAQRAGWES